MKRKKATKKNPGILSKAKEAYKDVVHAVTKKKKSAAALKRLMDARTNPRSVTWGGGEKPPKKKRASNPAAWQKYKLHSTSTLKEMLLLPKQQVSDKSKATIRKVLEKRKNPTTKRSNPQGAATELFEMFHGVPSKEVIEYRTRFHIHEFLGGLGQLQELVFFTPGAKMEQVTMTPEDIGDSVWLCASEDAKSLYILGEVDVDLEKLGYREEVDVKDCVELGRLTNVVYRTQKEFHELKMLDYDHRLGKREAWQKREGVGPDMNRMVAECPILAYHPREKRLAVIGGQYLVIPEGISN